MNNAANLTGRELQIHNAQQVLNALPQSVLSCLVYWGRNNPTQIGYDVWVAKCGGRNVKSRIKAKDERCNQFPAEWKQYVETVIQVANS